MGFQGPPAVDFYSQLSGLGDTLQANTILRQKQQVNAARQEAFSNFSALDPSSPDYGKQALTVAQKLGQAGDQEGALKFLTLAQTSADRAHTYQREGIADTRDARDFALREKQANKDKYTIKEQTDPNTGATTFVRVNTEGPEGPINTGVAPATPNNPFGGGVNFKNVDQAKSAGFTDRMLQSEGLLAGQGVAPGAEGPSSPGVQTQGVNLTQSKLSSVPVVGNYLVSKERQSYEQARDDFINAKLRQESGAAIGKDEFVKAERQYFPQPGDNAETIKQKAANRRAAIESMGREAGTSYVPKYTFGPDGAIVPYKKASGSAAPSAKAVASAAPAGAISALKKDPRLAAQFDAKYGPGAAKAALGGGEEE